MRLNPKIRLVAIAAMFAGFMAMAWFVLRPAPVKKTGSRCTLAGLGYSQNSVAKDPSTGRVLRCVDGEWVPFKAS